MAKLSEELFRIFGDLNDEDFGTVIAITAVVRDNPDGMQALEAYFKDEETGKFSCGGNFPQRERQKYTGDILRLYQFFMEYVGVHPRNARA